MYYNTMFDFTNPDLSGRSMRCSQLRLLPIEQKTFHRDRYFPKPDQDQIQYVATTENHVDIEKLLRYLHSRFSDQGLRATLIHKLFDYKSGEIAYYVPQLVFMAIKKNSKHLKKLLTFHAKNNESLKRLILWNVKAFTVMMKQKDETVKKMVQDFQNDLIETVKDKTVFTQSLEAIAMLTEASLILKKIDKTKQKEKLEIFIRRFNAKYLSNTNHKIMIPFRHGANEKWESDYVVHLVEMQCSCFPTRKRVPYRIIIETIDIKQLHDRQPDKDFFNIKQVPAQKEGDLLHDVTESVEKIFQRAYLNIPSDSRKLFAVDHEQSRKVSQLKTFFNNIQKREQQEKEQHNESRPHSRGGNLYRSTIAMESFSRGNKRQELQRYRIQPSLDLSKFEAIFIPDIAQQTRRSDVVLMRKRSDVMEESLDGFRQRNSGKFMKQETKTRVHLYEQEEIRDLNYNAEEYFGKPWEQKKVLYRKSSYFHKFDSLRLRNVVVKGGDDLRQEIICMQLIYKMKEILQDVNSPIFIKPYEIIVLSQNSGILEFVSNSISIDSLKKRHENEYKSLKYFYEEIFIGEEEFKKAQLNFLHSLVGSSILTFILKLKDRHNGNILLDMDGHIIHIDFGFILGMAPGNINFQKSPFKFTTEYLQLLGNPGSQMYKLFVKLFYQGMKAIRNRASQLSLILEIMMEDSDLDCFKSFSLQGFMNQFKRNYSDERFKQYCNELVEESCENKYSVYYDNFQQFSNGIMP